MCTYAYAHASRSVYTVADCLQIYRAELHVDAPTRRVLHDGMGLGRTIVRHSAASASFVNRQHEQLEARNDGAPTSHCDSSTQYMLEIETPRTGVISSTMAACFGSRDKK